MVMKSTTLPWTSGYFLRNPSYFFLIDLSIFLRSLAVIEVTGVPPTHTIFGFLFLGSSVGTVLGVQTLKSVTAKIF